jgi:hypothetical protein
VNIDIGWTNNSTLPVHDLFSFFGCVWWVGGQVGGVLLEQQQQQTILLRYDLVNGSVTVTSIRAGSMDIQKSEI